MTAASPALLITRQDMDDDTIYKIVSAIFANQADLQASHAQGRNITLDNALKGMSLPLHPGAEKFYKEKGLLK